jgi:CheY-like chemotaxis protein/DNA-binding transcriptional ArsR family regulator
MSRNTSPGDELLSLLRVLERLSDPERLGVLFALADGEEHSRDGLAAAVGLTPAAVGQHLRELARIGLVSGAGEGADKCFWLTHGVRRADGMLSLGRGLRIVAGLPLAPIDAKLSGMPYVMIVDDAPESVEPLGMFLERSGYLVKYISNARDALAEIIRHPPQVLVLDLLMPEMDGAMLLEVLRSDVQLGRLPVVVLTGVPDSPLAQRARDMNVNTILTKGKATFHEVEAALRLARHNVTGPPSA